MGSGCSLPLCWHPRWNLLPREAFGRLLRGTERPTGHHHPHQTSQTQSDCSSTRESLSLACSHGGRRKKSQSDGLWQRFNGNLIKCDWIMSDKVDPEVDYFHVPLICVLIDKLDPYTSSYFYLCGDIAYST